MFLTDDSAHSVPQASASIGVSFSYEKAVGNGAIMIVDGEVRVFRAGPTSQICKWMALSSKATTFSWTVAAEAAAVGKIAPSGSWCSDRRDAAWIEHPNVSKQEKW